MPRKNLTISTDSPYHVMNRSNNREWFYIPIEKTWRIFCETMNESALQYRTEIHAFVLMSNHYHLILSTPQGNLDKFMRHLQTEISRRIQRVAGRTNHVFGSRYKWSLLQDAEGISEVYKYVLRNPVRAGMSDLVQGYPYSTFTQLGRGYSDIAVVDSLDGMWMFVPRSLSEKTKWLNLPTAKEVECLIGSGLRRYHFALSRSNTQRLKVEELKRIYYLAPFGPGSR